MQTRLACPATLHLSFPGLCPRHQRNFPRSSAAAGFRGVLPRAMRRRRRGRVSPRLMQRTMPDGRACAGSAAHLEQRLLPTSTTAQQCARETWQLRGIDEQQLCEWWRVGDSNASARSGIADWSSKKGTEDSSSRPMAPAQSTGYASAQHAPTQRTANVVTLCAPSFVRTGCATWPTRWSRTGPEFLGRARRHQMSRPQVRGHQVRRQPPRRAARSELWNGRG